MLEKPRPAGLLEPHWCTGGRLTHHQLDQRGTDFGQDERRQGRGGVVTVGRDRTDGEVKGAETQGALPTPERRLHRLGAGVRVVDTTPERTRLELAASPDRKPTQECSSQQSPHCHIHLFLYVRLTDETWKGGVRRRYLSEIRQVNRSIENGRPITHLTYQATGTPSQPAGFFPDADFEAELLPFHRSLPQRRTSGKAGPRR